MDILVISPIILGLVVVFGVGCLVAGMGGAVLPLPFPPSPAPPTPIHPPSIPPPGTARRPGTQLVASLPVTQTGQNMPVAMRGGVVTTMLSAGWAYDAARRVWKHPTGAAVTDLAVYQRGFAAATHALQQHLTAQQATRQLVPVTNGGSGATGLPAASLAQFNQAVSRSIQQSINPPVVMGHHAALQQQFVLARHTQWTATQQLMAQRAVNPACFTYATTSSNGIYLSGTSTSSWNINGGTFNNNPGSFVYADDPPPDTYDTSDLMKASDVMEKYVEFMQSMGVEKPVDLPGEVFVRWLAYEAAVREDGGEIKESAGKILVSIKEHLAVVGAIKQGVAQ